MKCAAKIVLASLLFYGVAAAQTYTPEGEPTYSETQIRKAISACMAQAEQVAETKKQFPMPTNETVQPPLTEQLQACVIGNLEGYLTEAVPLG